jgi:hypothetical protein
MQNELTGLYGYCRMSDFRRKLGEIVIPENIL